MLVSSRHKDMIALSQHLHREVTTSACLMLYPILRVQFNRLDCLLFIEGGCSDVATVENQLELLNFAKSSPGRIDDYRLLEHAEVPDVL